LAHLRLSSGITLVAPGHCRNLTASAGPARTLFAVALNGDPLASYRENSANRRFRYGDAALS